MSSRGKFEVTTLAEDLEALQAQQQKSGARSDLEQERSPKRRPPRIVPQVVDWEAERTAAKKIVRSDRGVKLVTTVLCSVVGLRLAMSFFSAAEANRFTRFVYEVGHVLARPAERYFPNIPMGDEGAFFETSAFVALCAYFAIGNLVARCVRR